MCNLERGMVLCQRSAERLDAVLLHIRFHGVSLSIDLELGVSCCYAAHCGCQVRVGIRLCHGGRDLYRFRSTRRYGYWSDYYISSELKTGLPDGYGRTALLRT